LGNEVLPSALQTKPKWLVLPSVVIIIIIVRLFLTRRNPTKTLQVVAPTQSVIDNRAVCISKVIRITHGAQQINEHRQCQQCK